MALSLVYCLNHFVSLSLCPIAYSRYKYSAKNLILLVDVSFSDGSLWLCTAYIRVRCSQPIGSRLHVFFFFRTWPLCIALARKRHGIIIKCVRFLRCQNEQKRKRNTFLTSCGDWIWAMDKNGYDAIIFKRLTINGYSENSANTNTKQIEN